MDNSNLAKKINDLMAMEGYNIKGVAKLLKTTDKEILNVMRNEGFIYDRKEKYFIKEEPLKKRIELIEEQQKELFELINSMKKKSLRIDSNVLEGNIIPRTFKIYQNTSEKFTEFCNEHRELKMQEILTIALERYMEDNT